MIVEKLYGMPKIVYYHDVFTSDECDYVLNNIDNYQRSLGFDLDTKESKTTDWRTSSQYYDFSNKFKFINERVMKLTNYPVVNIEQIQILRYEPGEYYKPHYDFFNFPPKWVSTDNDRVATAITYLNDEFEGGYTNFPDLNIEVKPKKGSTLVFEYNADTDTNKKTLHGGLPVVSGAKYIATSWIRGRAWGTDDGP